MDEGDEAAPGWMAGDAVGTERHNGHQPTSEQPPHEDEAYVAGWVSAGGVLRWEPGEAGDADQAHSPLASEQLEMPEGAPDAPRVAAVRAWLARKREAAGDEVGALLLRQRDERQEDLPAGRRPRRGATPYSTVDLELAERQASIDEYALLAETLDDLVAHGGLARALVEFYLWLGGHLDEQVAASRVLLAATQPDQLAVAAWNGRAQAVVATRGRVERMMAPAADD
jgi:hypothetical protein